MAEEFKIGVDVAGLATLDSLGIRIPMDEFVQYAEQRDLSGGNVIGLGLPQCTWHWGVISQAEYEVLRAYCPSPAQSASIAIRTRNEENDWANYLGIMKLPLRKNFTAGRLLDFSILFTGLVVQV